MLKVKDISLGSKHHHHRQAASLSVCRSVVGHVREPCENGWTERAAVLGLSRVDPRNRVLDGVQISQEEVYAPLKALGVFAAVFAKKNGCTDRDADSRGPQKHLLDGVIEARTSPFANARDDKKAMRPFVKIL